MTQGTQCTFHYHKHVFKVSLTTHKTMILNFVNSSYILRKVRAKTIWSTSWDECHQRQNVSQKQVMADYDFFDIKTADGWSLHLSQVGFTKKSRLPRGPETTWVHHH